MKILVLYYSGVGNTKALAEYMQKELTSKQMEVDCISIENVKDRNLLTKYDSFIIGFPTIHAAPAKPILQFIEKVSELPKRIPVFLFTTCGLYSANTLRIFAKKCIDKNLIPIITRSYRCAATDGILVAPSMKVWYKNEKRINEKLEHDLHRYVELLEEKSTEAFPRFKFYSILNYPNKVIGSLYKPTIYVFEEQCSKCNKCITNCPMKVAKPNPNGYPIMNPKECIHCYRCIHHCPNRALSLSKKKRVKRTLFY